MPREIFRVTSAGSVDDGKSTLLARLLLDTGSIFDDQLKRDFDPEKIADLLDGLDSEREQGITIDVAHRFFDSATRRYQVADSPGHEQYTRNMATACAGSTALLLVIDVTAGLKPQSILHLEVALRLGIRTIVFAVNKMDLVKFRKRAFEAVERQISDHVLKRIRHFPGITFQVIPASGLLGHNVVKPSRALSWFHGPTLLAALDSIEVEKRDKELHESVFQVQYIQRLQNGGRRFLGPVIAGIIKTGAQLYCKDAPVRVASIWVEGEVAAEAKKGDQISITLVEDLDIGRGEILAGERFRPHSQFEVDLIWLAKTPGFKGHRYLLKTGSRATNASITRMFSIDLETNKKLGECQKVDSNQFVRANISSAEEIGMRPFVENPTLGAFVLVDQSSGQTVAAGTTNFALRRSANVTRQGYEVTSEMLAELTHNNPKVIWLTGLSGSGKSTLANLCSHQLYKRGVPHAVLDGDNLRLGINKDLGFTEGDRTENIRRTAEIAKLMCDAGLVVLVAMVSPLNKDREMARDIVSPDRFELVFVDTPIEVCEERDPKGLYSQARKGLIPNFTGVSSLFETPKASHVVSFRDSKEDSVIQLMDLIFPKAHPSTDRALGWEG